jgi:hypothetical protein
MATTNSRSDDGSLVAVIPTASMAAPTTVPFRGIEDPMQSGTGILGPAW